MPEIDFSLLGRPAHVAGHFQQGFNVAKAAREQRYQGSVLSALSQNPHDTAAMNTLFASNPDLAMSYTKMADDRQDRADQVETRSALSGWLSNQTQGRSPSNAFGGTSVPNALEPSMPGNPPTRTPSSALAGNIMASDAQATMPASGMAVPLAGEPQPATPQPGDPAWERLVQADPSGAMKALLGRHQLTKAQNEAMFTQMDTLARLARSAVDQPSYEAAVREADSLGIDTQNMPREFDPAKVNAVELQALTAKEHLQQERADRSLEWNIEDDTIDNARADRGEASQEHYRSGQLANGRRGQDMTDKRIRGSAGYMGGGGRGAAPAPATGRSPAPARATDPKTGHTIIVRNGQWVDETTGKPVS